MIFFVWDCCSGVRGAYYFTKNDRYMTRFVSIYGLKEGVKIEEVDDGERIAFTQSSRDGTGDLYVATPTHGKVLWRVFYVVDIRGVPCPLFLRVCRHGDLIHDNFIVWLLYQ